MSKKSVSRSLLSIFLILVIGLAVIGLSINRPSFTDSIEDKTDEFVDQKELKRHVDFLSKKVVPRSYAYLGNLRKAGAYIKNELGKFTKDVQFQTYKVGGAEFRNVVANFGPDTDEIIVIGAHYDAYSVYPAADDNASGVAGLIELAKLLSSIELKHRVVLVGYTLEEPPYFRTDKMGSMIHASSLKGKKVKIMISLEMIGYFTDEKWSQSYPMPFMNLFYPTKGNYIAVVDKFTSDKARDVKKAINKYTSLQACSVNAPSIVPGVDFSDHRNYWAMGYPAVMITDTAFYRNKNYHTENDVSSTLNYKLMAKVVYGVFKYIEETDQNK